MIITRTPFRISFFGGGTDYPDWYLHHGGGALATTIDKYCYLSVRYLPPFHEHRFRVVWSKTELVSEVEEIEHPAVRAVLQYLGIHRGVEVHHNGDLPARSGMGSSSAFTVGLLHALYALCGRMISKQQLAREAIHIEQEVVKELVGSQDQVSAAYGGLNHISFLTDGNITVQPLPLSRARLEELNSHLMLFYTGVKRTAAMVAGTYVHALDDKRRSLERMKQFVDEAIAILIGGESIAQFGKLLHEAWLLKRALSANVSNPQVDEIYDVARSHGALGGKLLGGGGFMLLFAPPESHKALREAFADLIYVPVRFEFDGSRVIFFDLDQDYQEYELARSQQRLRPVIENEAFTP